MSNSRTSSMRQNIEFSLSQISNGTPGVKKQRQFFADALVEDLMDCGAMVYRLNQLSISHIKKLLTLWQRKGNTVKTCHNKIGLLRDLFNHAHPHEAFPSNQALGLEKLRSHQLKPPTRSKQANLSSECLLESVSDKSIRLLFELQRYFGLKKREAIRFGYQWLTTDSICLSRLASYNSKNRIIPLWHPRQHGLLERLDGLNSLGNDSAKAKLLWYVHQYHLLGLGIHEEEYFRDQYIIERASQLGLNTIVVSHPSFQQLKHELGYQTNATLKEKLQCLGVY